jgi:lactoylglutathione lyase
MDTPASPKTDAAAALGKARMLHTMIRVHDLDKSIKFYTELLGMTLLRRTDYPEGKFTNVFVGYGDEATHAVLELTYNWDHAPYNLGDGYGHVALGVPDVYAACDRLAKAGAKIPRPAGPMKHGKTVIAFVEDPDGYKIELVQRA